MATQNQFLDRLYKVGSNNAQQALTLVATRSDNFHSGINCFNISNNNGLTFDLTVNTLTVSVTSPSYIFMNISIINNRLRQCPSTEPMFLNNMCYSACPAGYYPNNTYNFCVVCPYYCLTCSDVACTSCSPTRILTSGACPCISGYYENNSVCQQCNSTCLTCTSLTVCLSCPAGMTISGGGCICPSNQYYNSGCIACPTNCSSCQNGTWCTSCMYGLQLVNGVCLCNQTTEYLKNTACQSCSIPLIGCLTCNDNVTCLACQLPMNVVGGVCQCPIGQYYSAGCQLCDASCLTCSSSTNCLTCVNNTMSIIGLCQCPVGYYFNNVDCVACSQGCSNCTSSSLCQSCTLPYILSSGVCVCQPGWYYDGQCQQCHMSCATCADGVSCLTCLSADMVLNVLCQCIGYWNTTASMCNACPSGCLTCNQTQCLSCVSPLTLVGSVCACSGTYGVGCCHPSCQQCDATQCFVCLDTNSVVSGMQCVCMSGYYNGSGVCQPCVGCKQCIDNVTCTACNNNFILQSGQCVCPPLMVDVMGTCVCNGQCDDGNTIDNDGCTNCTIDFGYTCNGSICTKINTTYTLQLITVTKDPLSNTITMDIKFQPNTLNCSDITVNLTNISCTINQDMLQLSGQYLDDLQDTFLNVYWSSYTTLEAYVHPTISAYVFPQQTYNSVKILQYICWIILVLSIITLIVSIPKCIFIGIETVAVVQVSCLSLVLIDGMHPYLYSVKTLNYVNTAQWTTFIIDYQILIILLPYVLAVIMLVKKRHLEALSYCMATVCLTLLYSCYSLTRWVTKPDGIIYNYIIVGFIGVSTVSAIIVYFKVPFGQQLPFYLVVQRVLLGVCLVVAPMASVWICCCIPVMSIAYIGIKKPYKDMYNNVRQVINQTVMLVVILLYGMQSVMSVKSVGAVAAYVVFGLLFIVITLNNGAIIKYWLDGKNKNVLQDVVIEQPMLVRQFNISKVLNRRQVMGENVGDATQGDGATAQPIVGTFHKPEKFDMPSDEKNSEKTERLEIIRNMVKKTPKIEVEQWTEEERKEIVNQFDAI